jgi:hypothetical protein
MINEHYRYLASSNKTQYFFESEGLQGKIMKVILFTYIEDNLWNLGFGDWHKGKVDDSVVTNNQDLVKVISTVAKVAYHFFEDFPERSIEIKAVDERRKKLYNYVFQKHFKEIEPLFQITGFRNNIEELYSPNSFYDSFILKPK